MGLSQKGVKRQIFKPYQQKQMMVLPASLEELIPEGNLVRVVDKMIEAIDKHILEAQYKGEARGPMIRRCC